MNRLSVPSAWSLPARVRAAVCLLIAVLVGATAEWTADRQAQRAREQAGAALLMTTRQMADRLSQEMAARVRDVQLLARLDALQRPGDPVAARAALESLQGAMPAFAWIGITDADGTVVSATGDVLLGESIAERPVFRNGIRGLWTGDVHEAVLLAKLVPQPPGESVKFVDVAAPLKGADGATRGVIALHLSWRWADGLRELVLRPAGPASRMQLMVFNPAGQLLLPADRASVDTTLPAARVAELKDQWTVERWSDQRLALTAVAESRPFADFGGFGWQVVGRDVEAVGRTSVAAARAPAYRWGLSVGAVVALVAWWVIGPLLRSAVVHVPAANPGGTGLTEPGALRVSRRAEVRHIAATVDRLQEVVESAALSRPVAAAPSVRDPLTGLWNEQHLADLGGRMTAALASESADVGVLRVDIDDFKAVNDRYGQNAGDEVLVQVARRLRVAARAADPVFRLDGDSFLLLLTCPAGEGTDLLRAVAARVQAELQRPLSYRTLSNVRITAGVGGALWNPAAETLATAQALADEALVAAKRSGRGQFRVHASRASDAAPAPASQPGTLTT